MRRTILVSTLVAAACAGTPSQPQDNVNTPNSDAASGVTDAALSSLLTRHWEDVLRRNPMLATRLGDHRYDDRVGDDSKEALEEVRRARREYLKQAKEIAATELDATDQITVRLFIESMEANIATEVCNYEEWGLDLRSSPLGDWNDLGELHQVKTPKDGQNLIARYKQAPKSIDNSIANLSRGAKKQLYSNVESTKRVLAMFKTQLEQPIEKWPMMNQANAKHDDWSEEERAAFSRDVRAVLTEDVKPAFERFAAFVEKDILPNARSDDKVGLAALPFAKQCYAAQVAAFTTIETTPAEIHQKGIDEIARINGEMKKLGQKLLGTDDLPKILEKLRTDRSLYFASAEEVENKAKNALAAARTKIPDYFGILPKADCVVSPIPDYEAPFTTIAYYRQPVPDGSRPGQYFINLYQPTTRPKYEAEALAFHESIPGHHLQIAIAQELPALPAFRKHGGMTVFIEGWGLYSEQLANEMGLYTGDLDRMGMLSYEAWRASRLVVDTGLHELGWSRQQAKDYMAEHTALALNNIDNEVDRYINWPGQAVAYKTGQMEIWRLRHRAEKELGSRFDIKAFHDVVLKDGAVSLPILRSKVEAWIAANARDVKAS